MINLTLLAENTARGEGILGEHGLAFWIDTGTHRVLFDTGQGLTLLPNAARLGIDLSTADAIVLSHGHYDHVGGLETLWPLASRAVLHLHPRAIESKFSGQGAEPGLGRLISRAFVEQQAFRQPGRRIVMSAEPHEIVPGVWSTGEIPRSNDFEDTGGPFYLDAALTLPDPLVDEQSLYLPTAEGVIVLSGCAHAGVINTLRHIARLTQDAPVRLMLGGWHLENATPQRMTETIRALRGAPPRHLGFCHCTGAAAGRRLWAEFPDRCVPAHAGARWEFTP